MWPFSKKEQNTEDQEMKPPVAIGERFKYLGVEMVCSRHCFYPYTFDVVVAEYVNFIGEIKEVVFTPADWDALNSELKRNVIDN